MIFCANKNDRNIVHDFADGTLVQKPVCRCCVVGTSHVVCTLLVSKFHSNILSVFIHSPVISKEDIFQCF